jgi:methylenetetrahydrofolate dehydrogenase (NADP+)/methenyltetrahydrofolate cyclohydrolase
VQPPTSKRYAVRPTLLSPHSVLPNSSLPIKEGVVIIDVGTTRVPDATKKSGFKLTGDVKFDEVAPKCSFITPVPGGVGPMTIVSLMRNTLLAGKKAIYP